MLGSRRRFTRFKFSEKSTRKRAFWFLKVILIIVFFVISLMLLQNMFKIKTVNVVFDSYSCGNEEDVKNNLRLYDQIIFWLGPEMFNNRIKNDFPCVKEARLNKYLPNEVAVLIVGRVPLASIVKGEGLSGMIDLAQVEATAASSAATVDFSIPAPGSDKFFMDDQGILFYSTTGDANIPVIYVNHDVSIRQSLGNEVGMGVKNVMDTLLKLEWNPKLIKINNNKDLLLLTDKNIKVILNLKRDLLKQLASLQLIWQKNKIDAKRIESIDLRFTKPVVIYSK